MILEIRRDQLVVSPLDHISKKIVRIHYQQKGIVDSLPEQGTKSFALNEKVIRKRIHQRFLRRFHVRSIIVEVRAPVPAVLSPPGAEQFVQDEKVDLLELTELQDILSGN